MARSLDPFRFVLIAVAGWMNQRQLQVIDYLREENRVLREQLGGRRLRLNDDQRRRLAAKAKGLGRRLLAEVATIVTPETLLAWHRKLIAQVRRRCAARAGASENSRRYREVSGPTRRGERDWAIGESRAHCPIWGTKLRAARLLIFWNGTGIEPAPERSRKTTWREFLSRHWELIVAADFFTWKCGPGGGCSGSSCCSSSSCRRVA